MLYNQPYGVSDPNAAYVNGDPTTSTAGSIPPAASIEFPQREIVNLIGNTSIVPSNADLNQLAKAIQTSQLIYGVDAGTANAYQITAKPNPGILTAGMLFLVKIGNTNTGASVLNVNAIGAAPIVHHDGTPLKGGELVVGALEMFAYNGTQFELAWSGIASAAGPVYLTKNNDYYVDGNLGNDTYDGLSATFSNGIHGPFKTLQHAANQIPLYNLNGYNVNIHVAPFTGYSAVSFQRINGVGQVNWIGSPSSPTSCLITGVNISAVSALSTSGTYQMDGFALTASGAAPGSDIACIDVVGATSLLILGNIQFGPAGGAHLAISQGALVSNLTPATWTIAGGLVGSPYSDGTVIFTYSGGRFIQNAGGGVALNITGAYTITGSFCEANFNALVQIQFTTITGPALIGKKFAVDQNSEISTAGGGINYFPATLAGTQGAHGGYYS
jgi:hypothetical protein